MAHFLGFQVNIDLFLKMQKDAKEYFDMTELVSPEDAHVTLMYLDDFHYYNSVPCVEHLAAFAASGFKPFHFVFSHAYNFGQHICFFGHKANSFHSRLMLERMYQHANKQMRHLIAEYSVDYENHVTVGKITGNNAIERHYIGHYLSTVESLHLFKTSCNDDGTKRPYEIIESFDL